MLYLMETVFENIVDVYPLWVTSVGHSMITDKDDVHNIGEVSCFQRVVNILSKLIYVLQDSLGVVTISTTFTSVSPRAHIHSQVLNWVRRNDQPGPMKARMLLELETELSMRW